MRESGLDGKGLWLRRQRLRQERVAACSGMVVPVRAAAQGKNSGHGGGSRLWGSSEEGTVIENGGGGGGGECLFIKLLGN